MSKNTSEQKMQAIVSLCRRRAFIFQSSEIYGGLNGCWDYGPLGVELKRNVKEAWWRDMVTSRTDVVGIDCSILMNPRVWEASGHVQSFTDPMVDCLQCRGRFRADQLVNNQCPTCGTKDKFTEVRHFNLMFKTHVGALEDGSSLTYLRPETCQGIFANFKNIVDTSRVKVPFGIAQIGKAFRNEINPRNFTFRSREFEQMEMEFFTKPEEAGKWFEYWKDARYQWYLKYGMKKERLHLRAHEKNELAHYAAGCADIEYDFPFGRAELEGIANRTDYDLKRHSEFSKKDLSYFDAEAKQRFMPYVIEPSAGADRGTLAFLVDAYEEEPENERTVLRFHPRLAPIKVAVLPLVNKDGMPEMAEKLYAELQGRWNTYFDDKGAIGRRYRRQDEVGTPFCVTIDGETGTSHTVTVRARDSMAQERVASSQLGEYLAKQFSGV
jgi:glycyl-tRNA synthetase